MKRNGILIAIIEALLFFLAGYLVKVSFCGQLDCISNVLVFVCAIMIICYIGANRNQSRK